MLVPSIIDKVLIKAVAKRGKEKDKPLYEQVYLCDEADQEAAV